MNKPWLVRMHHRMRTASFAMMFVATSLHIHAKNYSPMAWVFLVLLFLVYPQLQYWRSCRAVNPVQAEIGNLFMDSVLLGAFMAALAFSVWLSFAAMVGTLTNNAANKGWRGIGETMLALLVGVMLWIAAVGFQFSPQTEWSAAVFCMLGLTTYLLAIGNAGFIRNLQLRRVREELRVREKELLTANEALVVNLQDIKALQQQLRDQASHDALTTLYNRRYLDSSLERELASCKREVKPLALLMMDVDHFKKFNDRYGHLAGDQCLISVARAIKDSAKRASDLAARYGGEEFVLLLPGTDVTTAQRLAEELRQSIESLGIAHELSSFGKVTISIGLAVVISDACADVASLLRAADEALYHAKHGGRNQVRLASQPRQAMGEWPKSVAANLVQLVWHSAYEYGHVALDAQHRSMFGQVNGIFEDMISKSSLDDVAARIEALVADVALHCADEEKDMLAAAYPGAQGHAALHHELLDHASYLVSRFKARDLDFGELFEFLAHDLVARHVLGADRALLPYLSAMHG